MSGSVSCTLRRRPPRTSTRTATPRVGASATRDERGLRSGWLRLRPGVICSRLSPLARATASALLPSGERGSCVSSRLFKDSLESGKVGVDASPDPTRRERPQHGRDTCSPVRPDVRCTVRTAEFQRGNWSGSETRAKTSSIGRPMRTLVSNALTPPPPPGRRRRLSARRGERRSRGRGSAGTPWASPLHRRGCAHA